MPGPTLPARAEALLPHAGRMCCVDSLRSFDEKEALVDVFLRDDHVLLNKDGVLDRAGFVELGAQAAGAMHTAVHAAGNTPPGLAMLAGIQKFTVYADAYAKDRLEITVAVLGELEGMSSLSFRVKREGELLAEGKLKVFMPGPDFSLEGGAQ